MAQRALTAALLLALATFSHGARAQEPPALVPPEAIDAGSVPYPRGATTEAVVIIELLVDVAGNVQDTRIIEGDEPFASATRSAAIAWKFQPAKRGDEFVPARVRMRVAFHPPVEASTSTPSSTSGSTSRRTPASTAPTEEVRVVGHREEPGEISMGSSEVRRIPGAFGDAFRVIDSLPGVTPIVSGLPFFFVRGAPPGDTGYFIDGMRMPLLFHVGVGPSVIQPGLVDRVDFFPANAPVEFGRFTGGIVSATTTEPSKEAHGEGNIRLFDAGGFVESPFADGKATAMIGGRYSYTGLLLPIFAPDTHLDYWDYQARVTYDLDDRDRVSVLALGSHDYLAEDEDDGSGTNTKKTKELLDTDFHRVDMRWDRTTSSHAHLRVAATLGYDNSGDHSGHTRDTMLALRTTYDNRVSSDVTLRLGADAEIDHYTIDDTDPATGLRDPSDVPPGKDPTAVYVPRNETTAGMRADVVYRILPRVEIVPGLRADVFTSRRSVYPNPPVGIIGTYATLPPVDHATAVPALDPRISMRVFATKSLTYFSALGLTHQEPSFIATFPGINPGGLDQGLQSAIQTSQGFEARLPLDLTARVTGFYSKYFDLTDATATCVGADFTNTDTATLPCVKNRVDGRAYGVELLVRRPFTKRWSGWLSYTLSRSTREARPLLGPADHLQEVPSEYDRTHVLSLATAYDLGKRWRAGARFYFYSGRPYTQTYRGYLFPPYDQSRLPDFWRLDVRLEKSWRIGKTGQIAFVVEGLNVTLNKETIDAQCPSPRSDSSPLARPPGQPLDQCPFEEIGPVTVPSVGLEGSF